MRQKPNGISLTQQETALLQMLQANRGQVVPRATLLQSVWGYPAATRTRTLDVHILHLRKKMEALGVPIRIQTVYRVGYCLAS